MKTTPVDSSRANDQRLLLLDERDNVLTLTATVEVGESILIDGRAVVMKQRLSLGHKLAARNISAGEHILRYGISIGSATRDIPVGEHVHTHNLKSDYLPTYLRETQASYFKDHH